MERKIINNLLKWKDSPYKAMKYFCKYAPEYHIACAGSLLGIALAKPSSFPVGKVDFMQIDPMTFSGFLVTNGDENLTKYMKSINDVEPIPDAFFSSGIN